MCECYQIGGRFIAEDPDCPVHGREAQESGRERDDLVSRMEVISQYGTPSELAAGFEEMLRYLRSQ